MSRAGATHVAKASVRRRRFRGVLLAVAARADLQTFAENVHV